MNVRYWISEDVLLSGSAEFSGLSIPPDSKARRVESGMDVPSDSKMRRSESKISATKARGSCGVDPGPARLRIVSLSASRIGNLLYGEMKRLVLARSLILSIFAMVRFTAPAVS